MSGGRGEIEAAGVPECWRGVRVSWSYESRLQADLGLVRKTCFRFSLFIDLV